ncbi:MAG: o-succinylbenzoate synthase [Microbacteriaceae bacterium]
MPALDELLAHAAVVALPLTTRFRGIESREAVILRGPQGATEFSPFVEYDDAEAAAWLRATIDFGWAADQPARHRDSIPVNATLPAVGADRVAEVLDRFGPCRTVKVKVAERGQVLADDVARVRAVRDHLGPEGRIRIDANGAWNVDEAEHAAHELSPFDLEYLEQPCASVDELAELRERLRDWQLPIAADESVRKASDPLAVARAGAADLLVIKAQPLGGIRAALDIVAAAGLSAVVSSAIDTSVGLSMGAHLAAALPELEFDCGLGTAALLGGDVTAEPLRPQAGEIPVRRVDVDADLLQRWAASPERRDWWMERVARAHAVLAGGM